jgi:hypothetical protein
MHEQLGPLGVKVYALNVPAFGENAQTLGALKSQAGLTYPVLNHQGTVGLIDFPGDNTFPYPRDAIVGPDGTVVYASNSYDKQAMWEVVTGLLPD